ncbi:MAG: imidazole glycerol phosphate synthase cyclase subunit [Pseudomonadota bacterium]
MLKKRLIPKLQMRLARIGASEQMVLVNTSQFNPCVDIGDPVSQAKIYEAQAADELIFLDIDASLNNRKTTTSVVRKAAEEIFMPFTVGGGVRSIDDFRELLSNGADKVSINTAAIESPELISKAAEMFGSQCVVLSIDYKNDANGQPRVWIRGGKTRTDWHPLDWAIEGQRLGCGEILLTSIDRDGTCAGLDLQMIRRIADAVTVPVIASGGCGKASHFVDGFLEGKADAVAAGTYFSSKDQNPMQARAHINTAGVPIRLHT